MATLAVPTSDAPASPPAVDALAFPGFTAELGRWPDDSPVAAKLSAGLTVLRVVDLRLMHGVGRCCAHRRVADRVVSHLPAAAPTADALRAVLATIEGDVRALLGALVAYAAALEAGPWLAPARDVLHLVAVRHVPVLPTDWEFAADVHLRCARLARATGALDVAVAQADAAYQIGAAAALPAVVRRARVSLAETAADRGETELALARLRLVADEAIQVGMLPCAAAAELAAARIRLDAGDLAGAVEPLGRAWLFGRASDVAGRALEDLVRVGLALGAHDLTTLAANLLHRVAPPGEAGDAARWHAAVARIEVAAYTGDRAAFDAARAPLATAPLPPALRAAYLAAVGEGLLRAGDRATAAIALDEAATLIATRRLEGPLARRVTVARTAGGIGALPPAPTPPAAPPPGLESLLVNLRIALVRTTPA